MSSVPALTPTPETYFGYVGHLVAGEVRFTPPVALHGPEAAWAYARQHGARAAEIRVTDDLDFLVLHVEAGRLAWPTEAQGVPAAYVADFNAALAAAR